MTKGLENFNYKNFNFTEQKPVIICARWNSTYTAPMLEGALEVFKQASTAEPRVVMVPGCFELVQVAKKEMSKPEISGCVLLGCIIQGETTHHELLANYLSQSLAEIDFPCPLTLGVVTARNEAQAKARTDKGTEAAMALLELWSI